MTVSNRKILIISVLCFLLFVGFSFLVHKNLFTHFDFDMTVRLQDHLPRKVDGPFSFLSYLGNFEITGILLLLFLILRKKWNGIIIFFSFAFFHIFELYGKTFVNHLPPPHFMLRTQTLDNFPQFYVSTQNSYPSGHSARALFVTTILGFFVWKSEKIRSAQKIIIFIILSLYDLVMLISRIYLGEHWMSDIIGGCFLGVTFALFSLTFISKGGEVLKISHHLRPQHVPEVR